jgi:hypothetical protein
MVPPDLEGMNDSGKFEIMGRIILFMNPKCS